MRRILLTIIFTLACVMAAHAQTKISALPSGTPATTDVIPFVANPSGTATTKKSTVSDLFSSLTPSLISSSNKNGTGSKFQLFTGSFSTNDCAKFDSAGNLVTNGAACNSGTVTSVGLSVPGVLFSVSGSPITSSGSFSFSLLTQNANKVFAGPSTGADATPTFRALVAADLPSHTHAFTDITGTATNSQLPSTLSSKTFDNSNSYTAKDGSFTLQNSSTTSKQAVFDLSNISSSTTRTINVPNANSTTAQSISAVSHQFLTAMSSQGVFSQAQPAASDISGLAASATTDTTNASNITSGTLSNSRLTAGQLPGTATNDNANSGNIGEYVESTVASGSAVSLTNNTAANVTSISLTAGDWDVWVNAIFIPASTTTINYMGATANTTTATIDFSNPYTGEVTFNALVIGANADYSIQSKRRLSLSATTTVYLVVKAGFGTSTLSAFGAISARRMR